MEHAFLPPSGAGVWRYCAGAPRMWQLYPERGDRPDALEGEASHFAGSEMLRNRPVVVGQVAPNGIVLTDEMIEGAELYVDDVMAVIAELGTAFELRIEERVTIPYVHEHNWGTPDSWLYFHNVTSGRVKLIVWDYKFGHEFVEVFENWQVIDYACGILSHLGIDGHADQYLDVEFRIVQPRSYHRDGQIRTWSINAALLRPYFNELQMAAAEAMGPDPQCTVNPGCKHCSGRHACEANQRAAQSAADISSSSTPVDLPPAALGLELRMLERAKMALDARVSGLQEEVLSHIRRGERVPFWGIEQGLGRETWTKPVTEVALLGDMCGIDVRKPGVLTPKQAIKKGLNPDLVAAYSDQPKGEMKLVPDDSLNARKVFGK